MKRSWAPWVRALRMLLGVERRPPQSPAALRRLFVVSVSRRCSFIFQAMNRGPQPASDPLFGLDLIAMPIERIQCLTGGVERNVTAGNLFGAVFGWHELHQNTITTGTGILFGIVVHTSERIFENELRSPGHSRRSPIAAIFEELKFKC